MNGMRDRYIGENATRKNRTIAMIILIIFFVMEIFNISIEKVRGAAETPVIDSSSLAVEDIKTNSIVFRKNAGEGIKLKKLVAIIGALTLYERGELGKDSDRVADLMENLNTSHMDYFAKKIYKSNGEFVKAMNKTVEKLGCKDTSIQSIDGSKDKDRTSVADLSMILGKAIDIGYRNKMKFNDKIEKLLSDKGKGESLSKDGKKIKKQSEKDEILGMKLFSSKEKDRVYTAVVGKKNDNIFVAISYGAADEKSGTDDGVNSLSYFMSIYRTFKVVAKGEKVGKVKIKGGRSSYCKVVAKEDLYVTLPREGEDSLVKTKLEILKEMKAPVKKGKVIGKLKALEAGEVTAQVEVTTGEDVVMGGPWSKIGISDYMMAIGSAVIILVLIIYISINRKKKRKRMRIEEIKRRRREEEARRIAIEREEKRRRNWPY